MGETHQSLFNLIVSTRLWGLSFNGFKKHPGLIFIAYCLNGTGAINKLIPWLIVWLMARFFPLFWAKLFSGKLVFHKISHFIPPCPLIYYKKGRSLLGWDNCVNSHNCVKQNYNSVRLRFIWGWGVRKFPLLSLSKLQIKQLMLFVMV